VWQNLFQKIDVLAPLYKLCLEIILEKLRTVEKLLLDSYRGIIGLLSDDYCKQIIGFEDFRQTIIVE
jgi:hypothetical protein